MTRLTSRRSVRPRPAAIDQLESRVLFATLIGLTSADALVTFDSATPNQASTPLPVTGLGGGGETLVGIDFRPATGQLFGLSSTGQIYTINTTTGAATAVGASPFALTGTNFAFDFNPQVDRIRIVSDQDVNLRANPVTGGLVDADPNTGGQQNDTNLAYATGDVNFGDDPNVNAAAYSNNFASTGTTTLYVLDTTNDVLATQGSGPGASTPVSPNTGQLFTVGPLGFDSGDVTAFDIAETDGVAYSAFIPAGGSASVLYTTNLTNGATAAVGNIGTGLTIKGLSAAPVQQTLFALASSGTAFATLNLAALGTNPTTQNITGLGAGDTLTSIDFRPATGQLFGSTADGQLYTINPATGAATALGTGLTPALTGDISDVDFNPTVDRLRVVTTGDANARANPDTGALVDGNTTTDGVQPDTALAYAAADAGNGTDPNIVGAAYTNSVQGATATTLYAIDAQRDFLVTIGSLEGVTPAVSPNGGQLFSVGTLGAGIDVNSGGLDIANAGSAYALLNVAGTAATQLYSINTTTGAATLIGNVGDGSTTFNDVAVGNTVFTVSPATQDVAEDVSGGNATITVTRGGIAEGAATVTFELVAPGAGVDAATAGSDFGTAGQTTFTGTVNFADGDTTETITVPILDDTTANEPDETLIVGLTNPTVGTLGSPSQATVVITDDDQTVAVGVADDPVRTGNINDVLTINGTDAAETIVVTQQGANIVVTVNGTAQGNPTPRRGLYRIVVNAGGGDDEVRINSRVRFPAEIHGEDGDDLLVGSRGRDLLIGGDGNDGLYGRGQEDILIGGVSDYTGNPTATATLLNVFLLRGNFTSRATAISTGSGVNGFVFNNTTIDDDSDRDFLAGEGTADLIFTNTNDSVADEEPKGLVQPV